jgi:hypothetical protein
MGLLAFLLDWSQITVFSISASQVGGITDIHELLCLALFLTLFFVYSYAHTMFGPFLPATLCPLFLTFKTLPQLGFFQRQIQKHGLDCKEATWEDDPKKHK